jgi:hypothetical protein
MSLPVPSDPHFSVPETSDDEFFNPKGQEDEALLATGAWDDVADAISEAGQAQPRKPRVQVHIHGRKA